MIIKKDLVSKLKKSKNDEVKWNTVAGTFSTNETAKVDFTLPELHEERLVTWKCHVTNGPMNYNMIIGRDLLSELGIDILFSNNTVIWDHKQTPFKSQDAKEAIDYHLVDSPAVEEATEQIKRILDAKYEKSKHR